MKKEDYKELNDKELLERLDAAEKEYVQTKIQHSISPSTILQRSLSTEEISRV